MQHTTLGRTGLRVSVLGLGAGGSSRLGIGKGYDADHAVALVRRALDAGVNFIDTAEAYRTEPIVGEAIRGRDRDAIVLSTKKSPRRGGELVQPADVVASLEQSLCRLGTDHVDVYHLHGIKPHHYTETRDRLLPAMQRLRDQGKVRAIGITEEFASDPGHAMLAQALRDGEWDVMMVGFNILNQSARERVIAPARRQGIGILDMFAVRNDLHQPAKLRGTIGELIDSGQVHADALDRDDPLGFVLGEGDGGGAASLPDAAYRFCRDEPGVHVVLFGTSSAEHLEHNVASMRRPPLPTAVRDRLVRTFARVDSVSGQ